MYAVLKQGGHQYRVTTGDIIQIEKIEAAKGDQVELKDVLLLQADSSLEIGEPTVSGASVTVKVLRQDKARKVDIYHFKRRHGYARSYGHRQPFTEVKVVAVNRNGQALA